MTRRSTRCALPSLELLLGFVLTLTAAVVGVWHIASRDRPLHGPHDDGTLGLPHLQRWSDKRQRRRFARFQESLPLLDVGRIVVIFVTLLVAVVLVAAGIWGWQRWLSTSPAEQADSVLSDIVTLHAQANASADDSTRYALLAQAEASAEEALAAAPADQARLIEAERSAIQEDLDRLTRVVRLELVQPVGSIPTVDSERLPQLFHGGGRTYLVADALYEVEIASSQLIEILRPGDLVAGSQVGALLGGTWRGDGPIVVDAERAYVFDSVRGEWDWERLGTLDEAATTTDVRAIGIFDLNLYIVDGAIGRIVKFSGGDYESSPEDWATGVAAEELREATDIAIDGNIYILQPDGSILKFFLNSLETLIQPRIQPPFEAASALVPTGAGFYIVNGDGRIARLSMDGMLLQQFSLRDPRIEIAEIRDAVIDESTGIALLLTANDLYTTRLVASDQ